jgi:hypothetical protein
MNCCRIWKPGANFMHRTRFESVVPLLIRNPTVPNTSPWTNPSFLWYQLLFSIFSPRHIHKGSSNLHNENITKQNSLFGTLMKLADLNCTAGTTYKLWRVQRSRISTNADMNVNDVYKHILTFHLYSFLCFNTAVIGETLQGVNSIFTWRDWGKL